MDSNRGRDIKKRKKSKEGQDIISNLPNFIVGRILSFLPTKEAVCTRILSKRWIYLWTFITRLDLKDREKYFSHKIRKTEFQNFVYMVLRLITSSIQSFSLTLSESHSHYHVNKWLSDILNRRVKELYIHSNQKLKYLSHSVFETMSLEVLVLKMNGCDIRVPTLVSLPYLIVLELSGITFTCYAEKLILTLPVLKKCKAQNCCWLNVKGITFEVPLLETLFINHAHTSKSEMSHTVIKFCAPCLSEFTCSSDYKLGDTILLDLDLSTARIANANIHLLKLGEENNEGEESMSLFACAVLKQFINNVECLKFVVSKNAYGDHLFHIRVPALTDIYDFGTLSCLELGEVTGEVLLDFLCKSPFLKTLVIFKLITFDEELSNPDKVPFCFISNLQVLKFERLDGNEHELRFLKFIMENARVLKRATFKAGCYSLWGVKYEEVKKKISSFKRSARFEFMDFLFF